MDPMAPDGSDVVQRRPGMYVGDTTDGPGLHRIIEILVDMPVDEAIARAEVTLVLSDWRTAATMRPLCE
ncbi:protein of unknown function with a putative DNA gyrase subunit B [Bradyrhizobium sp. ORS 285]|nr:hypothetical protein BRAO285_1580044 [Bradyrhizobium sp. ORS 285]SMX59174.1 protein of unknown function with a putative DNA gyrase subunit B [Bradyrhizobium sp. ORS 285]